MEQTPLFFWEVFLYLKEELKVELDITQYEAFVHLFLSGVWQHSIQATDLETSTKEVLKNICITLWVPQKKYLLSFQEYFDDNFDELLYKYIPSNLKNAKLTKEGIKVENQVNNRAQTTKRKEKELVEDIEPSVDKTPTSPPSEAANAATNQAKQQASMSTNDITMYLNISDEGDGGNTLSNDKIYDSVFDTTFIFSDEKHLPISNRKGLQLWRKLNTTTHRIESDRINIKDTVKIVAKNRLLYRPMYEMEKKGKISFLLFIEHDGPMVAFKSWWQQLIQHLKASNENSQVAIYYFTNYPLPAREKNFEDYHLFLSPTHTHAHLLSEVRQRISKHTNILFFSDAGALDGKIKESRIENTWKFIRQVQKLTSHLLWLNPLPSSKWEETSAAIISMIVEMVPYDFRGLEQGVKKLRE